MQSALFVSMAVNPDWSEHVAGLSNHDLIEFTKRPGIASLMMDGKPVPLPRRPTTSG